VQHEALARQLETPVAFLCKTSPPDAGTGACDADCAVRGAAAEGKAARDAAEALVAIPPSSDADTESKLADVRKSARELRRAFAGACQAPPPPNGPPTDAVQRCADARKQLEWNINDLRAAATRLAGNVEVRTGVKMPSPTPEHCAKLAR
jgi:hypothetical protein